MSRPVGSRNKPKTPSNRNGVFITKLEKQIENTPITKNSSMGWIKWGVKDNYANLLLDLYSQSPTHAASCNFAIASIVGNGVDFEQMGLNGDEVIPNAYQTWDEIIKSIATDYILYGSYAIQVIMNKDGKTFSFYHVPLDKVRWGEYDEDGNIPYFFISSDWTALGQNPPIQIDALNLKSEDRLEKSKPYLYVYRTYSPTMTYYQQPHYSSGIKAIQSEIEFINHDIKSAVNNFIPSGMLVLNEMESDEERQAVINNVQRLFTGTDNSNSLMISFRNGNIEQTDPTFVPFTANQGNVNIYADANQRTINRILCAHQIPSASLVGLPDVGNSGFASDSQKLETAYQLYQKLTGNANRMAVIRTLNQMLAINGIDTEIIMKPLNFNDFGDDANVKERTESTPIDKEDVDEKTEEVVNNKN